MELVNSIFAALIMKPLEAGTTHVVYPFKVSSNVHILESATAELRALKDDVKTEIAIAEHENRMATEEVQLWLSQVEAAEQKTEEICENYQQLCRCLLNSSPKIWSNYKISRNAAKKHLEVKSLCERRAALRVTIHKLQPLAPIIPASSYKSPSLELALRTIKDDDNDIIGIWGMGGVGKTHLLKQINNELSRDGAFNVIVFVTCSKECTEEKIQNEIIDKLSLSKNENTAQKKITIYNFLNQRNFLLLLDDLWSGVDLEMVGIPNRMFTVGTCKRKVVITTRSKEVCGQMEVRKEIRVDVLKWDDAWSLFEEKATEETINSDPLIQRCAEDVVKELGGLPLALIIVGRAMHDKTNHREWEHAIEQLKNARLDKSVFQVLKFSYDSLEDKTLKQCFLHCSLWPEDYEIEKRDLIELWMGLGLIDECNIQEAYNAGHYYIGRLQAKCLLEEIDGYRILQCVKMHDVIRDMALWLANNQVEEKNKWIVKAGISTKSNRIEISRETEKLSLMSGKTETISLSTTYSSSKLSTLLLQRNRLCDCKPLHLDAFSKLVLLDLSRNNLEAFPVEICNIVQLQFLNLSYNPHLDSFLPKKLVALINLKYLLLRYTSSCTIPKGILSKLKALRVLDLYGTSLEWTNGSRGVFTSLDGELQRLPHFQALGITIKNMYDFQMLSETSTVPVRDLDIILSEVYETVICFASVLENSQLQDNLVSLGLSSRTIEWVKFQGESRQQSISLRRLEELHFWRMENMRVVRIGLDPKDIFPRLQVLNFFDCPQLISISWVARLPCIRELTVQHCKSIKQLISVDELDKGRLMVFQPSLPYLKIMTMEYNDELESISDPLITFPALKIFRAIGCNKLRKLPFKTDNPPKELRLQGGEEWWNDIIEFDDIAHRTTLQGSFIKYEFN